MYMDDIPYFRQGPPYSIRHGSRMQGPEDPRKYEQITDTLGYDYDLDMFIIERKYYYIEGWLCADRFGRQKLWLPFGPEKKELEEQIRKWKEKKQQPDEKEEENECFIK